MLEEHNEDPALIQMRLLDDGGEELTLVPILCLHWSFFMGGA